MMFTNINPVFVAVVAAAFVFLPLASFAAMEETPVKAGSVAVDDFGGVRFHENSHSALDDGGMTAEEAAGIEPAAGPASTPSVPTEQELEAEYGTDVDQTVIDRGDHEIKSRDRLGKEEIGLFYDHKSDSRINDDEDAIGVEFRLLEFD